MAPGSVREGKVGAAALAAACILRRKLVCHAVALNIFVTHCTLFRLQDDAQQRVERGGAGVLWHLHFAGKWLAPMSNANARLVVVLTQIVPVCRLLSRQQPRRRQRKGNIGPRA